MKRSKNFLALEIFASLRNWCLDFYNKHFAQLLYIFSYDNIKFILYIIRYHVRIGNNSIL